MDHGYFKDRVSAYFDNELPPEEKMVVDEHIHACAECRKLLADLKRLDEVITKNSELAETDYWENAARKIEKKLEFDQQTVITKVPRKWLGIGRWRAVAMAASVVFLVLIGYNADKILRKETVIPTESKQPDILLPPLDTAADKAVVQKPGQMKDDEKKESVSLEKSSERKQVGDTQIVQKPLMAPSELSEPNKISRSAGQPGATSESGQQGVTESTQPIPKRAIDNDAGLNLTAKAPLQERTDSVMESETKSDVSVDSLAYWRNIRDSLITMQKKIGKGIGDISKYALTPFTQGKKSPPIKHDSPDVVEKKLINAWFNVARLTSDEKERELAIAGLKGVAENKISVNNQEASGYLKQLTTR